MERDQAFAMAEIAARTGIPMHPQTYDLMVRTIGSLSAEEESILASHRAAKGFDESRAAADGRILAEAAAALRRGLGL